MRKALILSMLAAAAACSSSTENVPTDLNGVWHSDPDTSYFASMQLTLGTQQVNNSLNGTLTAILRCSPGATTFTPKSTPEQWPCTQDGLVLTGTYDGLNVTFLFSSQHAALGADFTGTRQVDGTIRGTLNVRANIEHYTATNVVFRR